MSDFFYNRASSSTILKYEGGKFLKKLVLHR